MNISEIKTIAILHYEFPGGGAETVTINLAKRLEPMGIKVYVFVYNLVEEKLPKDVSNLEIIRILHPSNMENIHNFIANIREKEISYFIFPDVINDVIKYSDDIRKNTNCKIVFMLHSIPFWGYYEIMADTKKRTKGSFLKQLEWYFLRSHKYTLGIKKKKFVRQYKECYDKVDAFGVLCESYGREIAAKIGESYEASKFVVLNNDIAPKEEYVKDKKREVYFIGRLNYSAKRVDRLLRVWSRIESKHPEWNLNILGIGEEEGNLKQLASRLNLKRVNFLGFSPNPQPYYDRAAIVCMTSSFEGWPMVLLEAQMNGCVGMAFDVCTGINEILAPSMENGVLIKPFNKKEYAKTLSMLMEETNLRNRIAENGRKAVRRFSPENTIKQWVALFEKLS